MIVTKPSAFTPVKLIAPAVPESKVKSREPAPSVKVLAKVMAPPPATLLVTKMSSVRMVAELKFTAPAPVTVTSPPVIIAMLAVKFTEPEERMSAADAMVSVLVVALRVTPPPVEVTAASTTMVSFVTFKPKPINAPL